MEIAMHGLLKKMYESEVNGDNNEIQIISEDKQDRIQTLSANTQSGSTSTRHSDGSFISFSFHMTDFRI